jgi:hypothetical protein
LAATQIAIFFSVFRQTVVVTPFRDAVQWVERYTALKNRGDLFQYFIAAHNEHRPITIWLLTALDTEALGGRGLALIFAALASIAGIIALVLHEMRRNGHAQLIGPGALVIALVLTVPTDVDCSIPANTIFPITVFFALAALVLAVRERMLMAVISALLSTFTNAGGLAVWPPLLWIASTRAAWPWRVLLLGMMAAAGAIFLLGTIHTQRYEAHSYWEVVRYWPLFVGLPWSRLPALQIPAAIFGIGLFAAGGAFGARADRSDDLEAGAVAFLLFSLGCSFMAALGRIGIHEPYPAIRYSIFLLPAHLALLLFVLRRKWLSQPIAVTLLAVLVVQQALSAFMAVHAAHSMGLPVGSRLPAPTAIIDVLPKGAPT